MRGEVAIGPSIYGVYVIDGSLCSRVYGMLQKWRIPSTLSHIAKEIKSLTRKQRFWRGGDGEMEVVLNQKLATRSAAPVQKLLLRVPRRAWSH